MSKNIQTDFLDKLQQEQRPVTVFVLIGFQLKGQIIGHDQYSIQMDVDGKQQLIYKHAISTISRREG